LRPEIPSARDATNDACLWLLGSAADATTLFGKTGRNDMA
jgi:hypothetical protein